MSVLGRAIEDPLRRMSAMGNPMRRMSVMGNLMAEGTFSVRKRRRGNGDFRREYPHFD